MSVPRVVGSRAELREALEGSGRVVLVPTMGALHAGHASLMSRARELAGPEGSVVVSIFVNALQFAPGEDLDRYPRTLEADLAVCAGRGVEVVLAPEVAQMYPGGEPQVTVDPGPLGRVLEGASRPTHFRGVLTVVAKLFGMVEPGTAVFGLKDYQQVALVRRMVEDLCLAIDVVGVETVREPDGLALSSRNRFLTGSDRSRAAALPAALRAGRSAGTRGAGAVLGSSGEVLAAAGVAVDYLELTGPDLGPVPDHGEARLLVAARVGTTRLIDNMAVELG